MPADLTISVTEFKKRCLAILSDLQKRRIGKVVLTKRGKPIAQLGPAERPKSDLFGCMKGQVTIPAGLDLSRIDVEEPWDAEEGAFHR